MIPTYGYLGIVDIENVVRKLKLCSFLFYSKCFYFLESEIKVSFCTYLIDKKKLLQLIR